MSNRNTDIAQLRHHVANAEAVLLNLERQITDAIVGKRPVGGLAVQRDEVIEARDFLRARLARLEGARFGRGQEQGRANKLRPH